MEKVQFITELLNDDDKKMVIDPDVCKLLFDAMFDKASELVFESK